IVGLGIHRAASDGLLFHASVLVDLDVPFMLQVLNTPFEKISDKEIATITDRITTVRRETKTSLAVDEVRKAIARTYETTLGIQLVPGDFNQEELEAIHRLEREKYLTDEWIYQISSIEDTVGGSKIKTAAGLIDVRVAMAGSTIKAAYIGGDFFASAAAVADLEGALKWHSGRPDKVATALEEVYLRRREEFNSLPLEMIVQAVQKAIARAGIAENQAEAEAESSHG
ncbi:MAG TPA: lipoate protein ligase C-terminal domain-containing protein, partial [Anaerolineaceae bacterium]|nr:lipoate protein ligase C-terminal domain-containing protein [Anaerolineaceae bacterium]